jgi:hypothetical protein
MNYKQFRKEYSGAEVGVNEWAEIVMSELDEPKSGAKSTADTIAADNLRRAAALYLNAENAFAALIVAYGLDVD